MEITLEQAEQHLQAWLDADYALATGGQEYEIWLGGTRRKLVRADVAEIRKSVQYWQRMVRDLTGTRSRVSYISPKG